MLTTTQKLMDRLHGARQGGGPPAPVVPGVGQEFVSVIRIARRKKADDSSTLGDSRGVRGEEDTAPKR